MRATKGRRCGGTIQKMPVCNLPSAHQEVGQQDDGQERSHDEGQAVLGQHAELVGLADPIAQPVERALSDVVRIHGRAEQADRLVADGLAGKVLDDALQIGGDAAAFDQQPLAGEDEHQGRQAEQKQEQHDRKQYARQSGALGRPIEHRRQDVSDDAGEHERQQNQFDEIEKDGQDDRADHDGARFSGIERAGGTGALDRALLVAALTRQFHE